MVKQMKIIHSHGFSKPELISFKAAVLDNLLTSMKFVLRGMVLLRINLANKKNKAHARSVLSCGQCFGEDGELLPFVALSFCALWADQGVRAAAARGYEFQLNDSALYFFENINRIISPRYIPPEADVLRVRVRTSGIIETRFPVNHMVFRSRLGRGCCRTSHHCHVCGLQQDPQQACLPPLHHCHGHPQRTGGLPRRHGHRRQGELGELLIAISPDQGTFDCISALDTF
ncbi:guanine nucleotide-binding protein G(o) subunit alpha isoform X2 [Salmo salar]|nr:guanine nucleotide-binding protein G(o) subunit alpha-like isoform X2 [Salmo salar]